MGAENQTSHPVENLILGIDRLTFRGECLWIKLSREQPEEIVASNLAMVPLESDQISVAAVPHLRFPQYQMLMIK